MKSCPTQIMDNANGILERPQLEYCSPVWAPLSMIFSFEKVQQRTARFLKGDYHRASSVMNMISRFIQQSLEKRRVDMCNIVHSYVDVLTTPFTPSGPHSHHTSPLPYLLLPSNKNSFYAPFFPQQYCLRLEASLRAVLKKSQYAVSKCVCLKTRHSQQSLTRK